MTHLKELACRACGRKFWDLHGAGESAPAKCQDCRSQPGPSVFRGNTMRGNTIIWPEEHWPDRTWPQQ